MYRLDRHQQAIVEKAAKLADEHVGPHAAQVDAVGVFPEDAVGALAREGFLGLTVPAELGGMGQGLRVACAVLEEVSRRCASTGMVYLMHLCRVACYVASTNTAGRQLSEAARGKHLSTLAWSERGSRSHFWAPVSKAAIDSGRVLINAEKSWVTSAGHADGYVVSTLASDAEGPTDTTLYFISREDSGVRVAGGWDGLGMRGNDSAPVTLEGVAVTPDRQLSEPGKGFDVMLGVVLPVFQLGSAAVAVGIAEARLRRRCGARRPGPLVATGAIYANEQHSLHEGCPRARRRYR